MTYEELLNINSDTPDVELLKKFIIECDDNIKLYRLFYTKTRNSRNLGMITKHSKWRKVAGNKLKILGG